MFWRSRRRQRRDEIGVSNDEPCRDANHQVRRYIDDNPWSRPRGVVSERTGPRTRGTAIPASLPPYPDVPVPRTTTTTELAVLPVFNQSYPPADDTVMKRSTITPHEPCPGRCRARRRVLERIAVQVGRAAGGRRPGDRCDRGAGRPVDPPPDPAGALVPVGVRARCVVGGLRRAGRRMVRRHRPGVSGRRPSRRRAGVPVAVRGCVRDYVGSSPATATCSPAQSRSSIRSSSRR